VRGEPVVVVGGGASGTLTAVALRRRLARPVLLVSDAAPGPGLAYRTTEPYHLLNSPAATMSADPDRPDDFIRWCGHPTTFPARRRYGRYLVETLERAAGAGGLDHLPGRAVAVRPAAGGGGLVELAGGRTVRAAAVVLATGHSAPAPPRIRVRAVDGSHRYVNDPWAPGALAATGYAGPVLLIGTGLTAVDVALAIHRHNPDATVYATSRHGLLPTGHTDCPGPPWLDGADRPRTTRELLRAVRRSVAEAAAAGRDWRCVVDGLRSRADGLWEALPVAERERFVRHVDRYWQVCRHRMAPPVARAVDTMLAAGSLRPVVGRLDTLAAGAGGIRAVLRTRDGRELTLHCGTVVNCTGPGSPAAGTDPLAESLRRTGLARLNPLATGFDCDRAGALLGAGGRASTLLWAVGPIRRGASWETTAVPEIRAQAATVATALASAAAGQRSAAPVPARATSGDST
jgi:uncharacterized NAD(P)/FAD-binding protein YdhS